MDYSGRAEEAAQAILKAFEIPDSLPEPLAQILFRRRDDLPCRRWSYRNQLLVFLHGFSDARRFRQWRAIGRHVKAGERAFYIAAPVTKKEVAGPGWEPQVVVGYRGVPVFGYEQTSGIPLPAILQERAWVESLPLVEVARQWGLAMGTFDARLADHLGSYRRHREIRVGVQNLATWAHELVHAADDRLGSMAMECRWSDEVVAELGGAVLLRLLGYDQEADLGGCRDYTMHYALGAGLDLAEACGQVLQRTCRAVALILDTAEVIRGGGISKV